MHKKVGISTYYLLTILYLEICYKLFVYKHLNIGFLFMLLFSITISLLLTLITKLFKTKNSKYHFTKIVTLILIIFFCANFIYYTILDTPFSISTIALVDQAVDFYEIAFKEIIKNILYVVILFIPFIILILNKKKIDFSKYPRRKMNYFISIIISYVISIMVLLPFDDTGYKYYFLNDNLVASIDNFGLITSDRLNIERYLFGFEEEVIITKKTKVKIDNSETVYLPNSLNIDFESLINSTDNEKEKNLYEYLENSTPTYKNEYTGIYKDKNLIFILAEGFNSIAVSEELTPTLYKLTNTGFVFNNYYSPVFLSTTGGEFQATTGLVPTQETLNLWRKNSPTFSFALGNTFNGLGYTTNAYHDWTYTYYKRNLTMSTLGFSSYMGCGNGMEKLIDCKWLPSDIEMINKTIPFYLNEDKFMTYYISVSGHAPYNFTGGNSIASKNRDLVSDLPYSNPVKAYIASQIEFDRAIEALINNLKAHHKLDDTVIVITGDHYPYTLTLDEINEVSTYKRDNLEVNRSNLIIWNNNTDIIKEVDKVGSQIDVLPTILNLFGVDYDSRMIIGNDILSDSEGLAIFNDRSFVSDKGTYYSNSKKFVSKDNVDITDSYINDMNIRVDNSFAISKMILETDIYKKVLENK